MDGAMLRAATGERTGIVLDPRTKLILLLTVTTLMFSTSNEGLMNIVKPVLSLMPFGLILSQRRLRTAGKYLLFYAGCFLLERIAFAWTEGLLSFLLLAMTSVMTRFAPGIMTGAYLVSSTTVSEFVAAMERIHISDKIVIPLSVIFPDRGRGIWGNPGCNEDAGDTLWRGKAIPYGRISSDPTYGICGKNRR